MHDRPPPIWKAFSASERERFAEFDWGEWSVQAFRQMRRGWLGYLFISGLVAAMFSWASTDLDQRAAVDPPKERDPWALDETPGDRK